MIRRALARTAPAIALALAAACAASRPALRAGEAPPGWTRREFPVDGHGRLLLALPPGWVASEEAGGEAGVTAIVLTAPGSGFRAVLSPLWSPPRTGGPKGPDLAQLYADVARHRAAAGATESALTLERLEGPGVRGYWFAATDRDLVDREPGEGEWRHLMQGAASVGPVLLTFALLDNAPGEHRAHVLEVVRTARAVADGGGGEAAEEIEPLPGASTLPLRLAAPGRSWAVLVDGPGFTVGTRRGPGAPEPNLVAMDPRTEILATLAFRPAGPARDAGACREAVLAILGERHPALAAAVRSEGGPAARATWSERGEDGVRAIHGHAFLLRDALCAHLHLSKLDPAPGDEARLEAILATIRFGEEL